MGAPAAHAVSPDVVVSQVYGGGGNSGAPLQNDYIELYNRGTTDVDLSAWTVQYASAAGSSWQVTPLSGTIAPDGRYLVQQAAGANAADPLPTPDATGSIAMSATAGKVPLVTSQTALTLACGATCATNAAVRDYVGYGSAATNFEAPAPRRRCRTRPPRCAPAAAPSTATTTTWTSAPAHRRRPATAVRRRPRPPGTPATIHEIQGATHVSRCAPSA